MACVDVAAFPLQLLLRDHPDWKDQPAAVVDQDKAQGTVLWVNSRARATGILPGMRYGAGLALSRHRRAGVISRTAVDKAVADLVPRLRRFAAEVEPSRDEPGVFWLGASGLSLLHPRLEEWAGLIHRDLAGAGLHNTVAVGFSRFGSYAAAKACDRNVVFRTSGEEHDHVRAVRLDRLDFAPKVRDLLARLGIHTLGGFLDLPASQVRARLGREAHRLHRLAAGDLWSPLHPETPFEPTTAGVFLDYPESDRQRLAVLMEELLEPLLDALEQRHEVMTTLLLRLRLDDRSEKPETLRPARPTLDRGQILNLLRLRLEATALTAGVTEIVMELQGASSDARQGELFHGASTRDHDAANRALARLRARFGDGALLRARPRAGHLPEARFTWEPMETVPPPRPRRVRLRPLVRRFFPKPVRLPHQAVSKLRLVATAHAPSFPRSRDSQGRGVPDTSFPRKRESRGGEGALQRRFPAPPPLDSRFRGNDDSGCWHRGCFDTAASAGMTYSVRPCPTNSDTASHAGSTAPDAEPVVGDVQAGDTPIDVPSFTRESAGPYVISGGWWGSGAGVHREYHFVRDGEGPWLWIYYDSRRRGWFLHGKVE